MAVRSSTNRYQNYTSCPSLAVRTEEDDSSEVAVEEPGQNRVASHNGCPTNSSRLEYIINSMAYIRGELVSCVEQLLNELRYII